MPSTRRLSAAEARSANGLCHLAAILGEALGVEIRYHPSAPESGDLTRVDLTLNESHLALFTSQEGVRQVARDYLDLTSDYPLPEPLKAAAFESAVAGLLSRIEDLGIIKIRIRGLSDGASLAGGGLLASFQIAAPGWPAQTVYLAGVDGPLDLPALLPKPPQRDLDDLALRFPLEIGHSSLPLSSLTALAAGDILLIRSPEMIAQSTAFIPLTEREGLTVAIDGNRLTIIKSGRTMATDPSDESMAPGGTDPGGGAAAAGDQNGGIPQDPPRDPPDDPPRDPLVQPETIDDVRLRLTFDLGEIELTISELRSLVAGQAFDLANLPEKAVRIRLNGRQIGTGEIVEIGNRVGVRVGELMG